MIEGVDRGRIGGLGDDCVRLFHTGISCSTCKQLCLSHNEALALRFPGMAPTNYYMCRNPTPLAQTPSFASNDYITSKDDFT